MKGSEACLDYEYDKSDDKGRDNCHGEMRVALCTTSASDVARAVSRLRVMHNLQLPNRMPSINETPPVEDDTDWRRL